MGDRDTPPETGTNITERCSPQVLVAVLREHTSVFDGTAPVGTAKGAFVRSFFVHRQTMSPSGLIKSIPFPTPHPPPPLLGSTGLAFFLRVATRGHALGVPVALRRERRRRGPRRPPRVPAWRWSGGRRRARVKVRAREGPVAIYDTRRRNFHAQDACTKCNA